VGPSLPDDKQSVFRQPDGSIQTLVLPWLGQLLVYGDTGDLRQKLNPRSLSARAATNNRSQRLTGKRESILTFIATVSRIGQDIRHHLIGIAAKYSSRNFLETKFSLIDFSSWNDKPARWLEDSQDFP